jgi:H+-transporting ATPase
MFIMQTPRDNSEAEPPTGKKAPDIASVAVPAALAALHVNPETGLAHAEVNIRRQEHGYNEVAEKKGHPVRSSYFSASSGAYQRGCSS